MRTVSNRHILIFGKGFLGQYLQREWHCHLTAARIERLKDIDRLLKHYHPKILINCIGFHEKVNIDDCDADPDGALQSNSFVPLLLVEAALRNKIKLIHISSGCVFHSGYSRSKPISDETVPDYFETFFARTKIYSELALVRLASQHNILISRIRAPLDFRPHSKNILNKLIRFKNVIDVPNSITYLPHFVLALEHLIKIDARGVYNVVNRGTVRFSEILQIYQQFFPNHKFRSVRNLKLKRTNLILSCKKLERTGFIMPDILSVLETCVKNYCQLLQDEKLSRI